MMNGSLLAIWSSDFDNDLCSFDPEWQFTSIEVQLYDDLYTI